MDDWYNSDVDEVLFSAPKGILKDINEAMELIHTCVDRELYKDGYGLSEILSVLEVSSEGDYCDYDGAPLYMCGLDQYNLLGHEYIPFVKECLYLAYLELNEVQLSKRTGIRAGILKIVSKKGKGMTVQKG